MRNNNITFICELLYTKTSVNKINSKTIKNTINNKQFKFMLRNNSFNKPGLSTEHNDTDGDEILVSKTFSHHPSCINF